MQQLSAQDAQFLYMESENNLTHVLGVSIYDPSTAPGGKVRLKDIIGHVESRLHTSPIFKRRLVRVPMEMDHPYWVDDEYFDLESHIHHGRLPDPGDWRQLCIHIARYHSRPLDMNRPLWEMFVIEGLDNIDGLPGGSYAIATKIHHAAVDGASSVKFFAGLTDIDAEGTPVADISIREDEECQRPGLAEMMKRAMVNNIRSPVKMADTLIRAVPSLHRARRFSRSDKKTKQPVPETRFNQTVSPHKMFDATIFDLEDFKTVRRAVEGATINDVILAVISGGLRRYLEHHDELPEDPLIAWVPINARPKGAADNDTPGNNITAMTAAIHTQIADPLARLQAIMETTQQTKEAKSGQSARLMTDLSQHMPAATQLMASRLVMKLATAPRVCNLFVSNVPGPQMSVYMNGARVVRSLALAPLGEGMGLFIATPSYDGQISFNVISTREILPDIRFFISCLEQAMEQLRTAASRARGTKRNEGAGAIIRLADRMAPLNA